MFKKRQILEVKKMPDTPVDPEPEEQAKPPEISIDEVFDKKEESLQIAPPKEAQEVAPEKTLEENKKDKYAYLAEARKKSLEVRRKRAAEKKARKYNSEERILYEQLKAKYGDVVVQEKVVATPPPVVKEVPANYPLSQKKETPPVPQQDPMKQFEPPRAMSATQDTPSVFDYDRIVNALSEKMTSNQQYLRDLEQKIREDERKKSAAELEKFKYDQHRKAQAEIGRGLLSRNTRTNRVYRQTSDLRQRMADRYKNNWY